MLAVKQDGSPRLAIDYRKLNEKLQPNRHPLPRVDEILETLGGNAFFSVMDAQSGYWQLPIAEEDRHITAFRTHSAQFEWKRLPMGIQIAGGAFQKAMDTILAGLSGICCVAYVDDCLVYSPDFDSHLTHLDAVLSRMEAAGMTFKAKKCFLASKKLNYLGYVVTPEGVHTDPRKVAAVTSWPVPKTAREARAFMGLVNYYRRFIRNCASIASPIINATRTGKKGEPPPVFAEEWAKGGLEAFRELQRRMQEAPILKHPDFERTFIIDVDASKHGVGGVLSQVFDDGREHPVSYFSKKLSSAESIWGSTDIEAIGVLMVLDEFRPYIYGSKFVLRTDNIGVSLAWLRKQTKGKLARWAARLGEYDGFLQMQHRSGVTMGHVDGLSRRPHAPITGDDERYDDCMGMGVTPSFGTAHMAPILEGKTVPTDDAIEEVHEVLWKDGTPPAPQSDDLTGEVYWDIQRAQRRDKDLGDIILMLEGHLPATSRPDLDLYRLRNHMLWRSVPESQTSLERRWVIAIPKSHRALAFALVHEREGTAHRSTSSSYNLMKSRFYWRGMNADVKEMVRTCPWCQRAKAPRVPAAGHMQNTPVRYPNELVSVDFAGPFTSALKGKKYVLTMVDAFTGWAEVTPVDNMELSTTISTFHRQWVRRYGPPRRVITDRGTQFTSPKFTKYLKERGIRPSRTTVEHPQTNGYAERVHKWLTQQLKISQRTGTNRWHEDVPSIVFAHNVTSNAGEGGLGSSPYLLWFARKPRIDIDCLVEKGATEGEIFTRMKSLSESEHKIALDRRQEERLRKFDLNKRSADKGKTVHTYQVGDWVMIRGTLTHKKSDLGFLGPYPVVAIVGENLYKVRHHVRGVLKTDTRNGSQLRPWLEGDPLLTLQAVTWGTPRGLRAGTSTIPGIEHGVRTTRMFPKGHLLGTLDGDLLDAQELESRHPTGVSDHLLTWIDEDGHENWVDTTNPRTSNWGRFLNCCGPREAPNIALNAAGGTIRITALRDLVPNEELVWNYAAGRATLTDGNVRHTSPVGTPRDTTNALERKKHDAGPDPLRPRPAPRPAARARAPPAPAPAQHRPAPAPDRPAADVAAPHPPVAAPDHPRATAPAPRQPVTAPPAAAAVDPTGSVDIGSNSELNSNPVDTEGPPAGESGEAKEPLPPSPRSAQEAAPDAKGSGDSDAEELDVEIERMCYKKGTFLIHKRTFNPWGWQVAQVISEDPSGPGWYKVLNFNPVYGQRVQNPFNMQHRPNWLTKKGNEVAQETGKGSWKKHIQNVERYNVVYGGFTLLKDKRLPKTVQNLLQHQKIVPDLRHAGDM